MTLVNYALYKEGGVKKAGDLSGYDELSIEMDIRLVPLYISHKTDTIVVGSLLSVSAEKSREERLIFFQEYSKRDFLSDITVGLINYYKDIFEAVDIAYQSKYKPVRIGNESIDFNSFFEKLELINSSTENLIKNDKSEFFMLIGKLLSFNEESNRKIKVFSDDLVTAINFVESMYHNFPHFSTNYSIVFAYDIFTKPVDIVICQNKVNCDYEIQSNQLSFSKEEQVVFYNFFMQYFYFFKNKLDLSRNEIKTGILKNFPLGILDNDDSWEEVYENSDLNELIQEIINIQYYPSLVISFLWGLNEYEEKEDVVYIVNQIKDNPICEKVLKHDFREILKKDPSLDAYFKEKLQKKYNSAGEYSAISKVNKIFIGVIISLSIISILLFVTYLLKILQIKIF